MEPIHLFELAAQQQRWLSVSQQVIAGNVSNANTPGYTAQTVVPFQDVLSNTQLDLASTNPAHLGLEAAGVQPIGVKDEDTWETTDSGNSVSVEQEMINANDVNRSFSLNVQLMKAFHSMLSAATRSSS